MTRIEVAALLEALATQVIELPGVSRTRPHAFAEAKSELAGAMIRQAKDLRTSTSAPIAAAVASIRPGVREVGGRRIPVVTRSGRVGHSG